MGRTLTRRRRFEIAPKFFLILVVLASARGAVAQQWTLFSPIGQPPSATGAEIYPVYDRSSNEIITFGGLIPCCTDLNGVWTLSNANGQGGTPQWSMLTPATPQGIPAPRAGNSVIYDTDHNRMVIFGGGQDNGHDYGTLFNDTWVLANANGQGGTPTWIPLNPIGGPPSGRADHRAVYDKASNRMIIFGGGNNGIMSVPNDVWVLTNANGLGGTPQWIQLNPTGQIPPQLEGYAAGYDPANNVLIVSLGCCGYRNTTYTLSNANGLGGTPQWTELSPSGTLPAIRATWTYGYNASLNQLLVFGTGATSPSVQYNDFWVLNGANSLGAPPSWLNPIPNGAPGSPPAVNAVIGGTYDPISDRLIVLRTDPATPSSYQLWVLSLAGGPLIQGWTHTWGGGSTDSIAANSRDANGNLYVAGSTSSFGAGGQDALVQKYDPSGNLLWTKTWGGTSDDYATAVAVDSTGNNIYVTGGTRSFGAGWFDVFLLKFDSGGNLVWSKTWGGSSYDVGHDIAFDSSGNVLVAAETYSYNPPNKGSSSGAVLKFTPAGSLLWSRVWASGVPIVRGPVYDGGYSLDVDGAGNILLSGITWDYNVSPYHNSIFVVKWDSSGNFLWNRNWAGPSEDEAWGTKTVRADPAGNVYVAGRTASQCTSTNFATCDFDVLLLKLNQSGNFVWSKTWKPGTGYDTAISFVFDPSGNIVITGAKDEFGPTAAPILLRFDPSGNLLSSLAWSGGPGAVGSAVTLDPSGDVFVAGNAPNNKGSWQVVSGVTGTESGTLSTQSNSAVAAPTVTLGSPSATVTSPTGVMDTGGGGQDALVSAIPANYSPPGGQPVAVVSPSPLSFPHQTVNTTSGAMAVTVTNTGSANLDITGSPSIGGTNAADFAVANGTTCTNGASISPGSSCVIEVTFAPSTTTSESGLLSIYDNAGGSPQSVSLNGTGSTPLLAAPSISSLSDATVVQGQIITTFTVTGSNFSIAPPASVSFNPAVGIAVGFPTVKSSSEMSVLVTVSSSAVTGPRGVTVTNADGQKSNTKTFTIVPLSASALPKPTGLSVWVGNAEIYLKWDPYPFLVDQFQIEIADCGLGSIGSTTAFADLRLYLKSCSAVPASLRRQFSCGTYNAVRLSSCLLSNASPLQNNEIYGIRVLAQTGGVKSDYSDLAVAMPTKSFFPAHPDHPVLFLHGFLGAGSKKGTWNDTVNFLEHTLGWNYGGELYHRGGELNPRIDRSGMCAPSETIPDLPFFKTIKFGDITGCVDDSSIDVTRPPDFFTAGFGNNIANYSTGSTGLSHQGDEVGAFVDQLIQAHVPSPFVLVAHSNGGLAARDFMTRTPSPQDPRGLPPIAKMITYGTPHRGADVQRLVENMVVNLEPLIFYNCGPFATQGCIDDVNSMIALFESPAGATDVRFVCNPSGVGSKPAYSSGFLKDLSTRAFPDGPTLYVAIGGTSTANYPVWPFDSGQRQPDCLLPTWDGLVPLASADLGQVENPPPQSKVRPFSHTDRNHNDEGSDFSSILCALDDNCAVVEVHSPVDIEVTAPSGRKIAIGLTSIPGASYMNVPEADGHDGATVLIPFPEGGQYTIKAMPKAGALSTDTFTIMLTQNGVTTPIAQDMPIKNIPSSGFQATVKPSGTPVVSVGGSAQQPLARDSNGNFVATVTVTNQGNVTIDSAQVNVKGTTLGTTAPVAAPVVITNLAPGATATVTLVFPKTAASSSATTAPLKISGTYKAGTLTGNWSLTFRSVALTGGGPQA
jgi:hypothetical protein